MIIAILAFLTACKSQIQNTKTQVFEVSGVCNKCKATIESASNENGISNAIWDVDSKKLTLTYDSLKTSPDKVLKQIAYSGYDNEKYLAPDEAYAKLDECCKYERKASMESVNSAVQNNENSVSTNPEIITSEINDSTIFNRFYESYFALKDALINGSTTLVSSAAKELYSSSIELNSKSNLPFVKLIWSANSENIIEIALAIQKGREIELQRQKFKLLTPLVKTIIEKVKPDYPVYLDHCPMYDDGKGADWLSKEKEIRNPFYGSMMMNCGSQKAMIQ